MKRLFRWGLAWVGVLALLAAFSVAGCQTAAPPRADGLRGDAAAGSEAGGDRPCRFG